jgi:hypothetical protein
LLAVTSPIYRTSLLIRWALLGSGDGSRAGESGTRPLPVVSGVPLLWQRALISGSAIHFPPCCLNQHPISMKTTTPMPSRCFHFFFFSITNLTMNREIQQKKGPRPSISWATSDFFFFPSRYILIVLVMFLGTTTSYNVVGA